jgi:hypothetical protein
VGGGEGGEPGDGKSAEVGSSEAKNSSAEIEFFNCSGNIDEADMAISLDTSLIEIAFDGVTDKSDKANPFQDIKNDVFLDRDFP